MKKKNSISIVIIQMLIIGMNMNAQSSIVDLGRFPVSLNPEEPLETSKLLEELEWDRIKEYSENNDGHYAYERKDSLVAEYEYVQQGRVASFKIISFNGSVMEFNSEIANTARPSNIIYFDKNLWISYVNYRMPNLEERFKINTDYPKKILKAYYILLGVDSRDEYGWICEYSGVGIATKRRLAVLELLGETELLRNLLEYPNIQTRLYAVDALIYSDYFDREMIKKEKAGSFKRYLKSELLPKSVWKQIYEIRDSNEKVWICGNAGSYKIYGSNTMDLLSDKAIEEIPKKYEMLRELGYLR